MRREAGVDGPEGPGVVVIDQRRDMKVLTTATPEKAPISAVWRIVRLSTSSDAAVRLWLFYRSLHVDAGAYPADPTTANVLGWSQRKVQGARAELVRVGLLVVRQRGPRPPAYFPLDPAALKGSQSIASLGSQDAASLESEGSQEGSQNSVVTYKERTCKPVKLSPKGPEKPGRDTWLTPFFDVWKAQYGGSPPGGRFAAAFKPLVDEHGADAVVEAWRNYVADTPAKFNPAPEKFVATFGSWSLAADPAIVRALRERDRAKAPVT